MPPNHPSQPITTTSAIPTPPIKRRMSRTAVAILLMVGPTALLVISIVGFAIVNFVFSGMSQEPTSGLFAEPSNLQTGLNVLLFLVGAIVVATWLPGLIIGIVLLATKKKVTYDQN